MVPPAEGKARLGALRWWACFLGLALLVGCNQSPASDATPQTWLAPSATETMVWPDDPTAHGRIKFLISLDSPEGVRFKKSWSQKAFEWLAGAEQNRFVRPYGVAALDGVALAVTDPGSSSVHLFDFKRQRYRNLSLEGEGGLVSPTGVALDSQGRLFVADSGRAAVFVLTLGGKLLKTIGAQGELARPVDVALHPGNGRLYVVDALSHQVVVYDADGRRQLAFGRRGAGPGEFNFPTHIFLASSEEIYITDSMNFRVQAFSTDGTYLFTVGRAGDSAGDFSKPKGVAVDRDGHIYVADAMFDTVQILSREGIPLLAFGSPGQEAGQFWMPSGLWIDSHDRIYVADSFNQRVQIFQYVR